MVRIAQVIVTFFLPEIYESQTHQVRKVKL